MQVLCLYVLPIANFFKTFFCELKVDRFQISTADEKCKL